MLIISLSIPIILTLLILNWFFTITHYQWLQGAVVFVPILISPAGAILGIAAYVKLHSKTAKIAVISNAALFFLPFIYMIFDLVNYICFKKRGGYMSIFHYIAASKELPLGSFGGSKSTRDKKATIIKSAPTMELPKEGIPLEASSSNQTVEIE